MSTKRWIHCPGCGHRLFFLKDGDFAIEIKCPSCKRIMPIDTRTITTCTYRYMSEGWKRYHGMKGGEAV